MKKVLLVVGIIVLAGCSVKKQMTAIGGSKSDGTVRVGYSYGQFEKPVVDLQQGTQLAAQKCQVWGYNGAEPFGGQQNQCSQTDMYGGCVVTNVSVEYQCTGGKAAQN